MGVLLDTHTFLWALNDAPQLSRRAAQLIDAPDTVKILSVASLWAPDVPRLRALRPSHSALVRSRSSVPAGATPGQVISNASSGNAAPRGQSTGSGK